MSWARRLFRRLATPLIDRRHFYLSVDLDAWHRFRRFYDRRGECTRVSPIVVTLGLYRVRRDLGSNPFRHWLELVFWRVPNPDSDAAAWTGRNWRWAVERFGWGIFAPRPGPQRSVGELGRLLDRAIAVTASRAGAVIVAAGAELEPGQAVAVDDGIARPVGEAD